jgi:hypothetical protein
MAMDHAALLKVLEAMKSAGVDERIRLAATTIYQALIDAELTSVIGAGPWERTPERRRSGMVIDRGCCRLQLVIWSWRSRSCGRVRSFHRCWSDGAGWIRRCSRW